MSNNWKKVRITDSLEGEMTTLDNGLLVCLVPTPDFQETYAQFTTRYGSINNAFVHPITGDEHQSPDGVAHFLEHKMFDQEDGTDVMVEFSKLGASSNAFTSHTQTTYLFSSNQRIEEATMLLLDYVQSPHFTEDSVEKEKGIIAQEIEMYEDDFGWVGYREGLNQSYPFHPVGIDIAGTVESIMTITAEELYACHDTFYHPSNMQLILVGNFDVEVMKSAIQEIQEQKSFANRPTVDMKINVDDTVPATKARRKTIDAQTNYVTAILKDVQRDVKTPSREELIVDIILDMLFSDFSIYKEQFEQEGIVDTGLSYFANYEKEYGYLVMQAKTQNPTLFIDTYKNCWYEGATITEAQFNLIKKYLIGQSIQAETSNAYLIRELSSGLYDGITPKVQVDWLKALTFEEVKQKYESLTASLDIYLSFVLLEGKNE